MIRDVSENRVLSRDGFFKAPSVIPLTYTRPSSWLTLPTVTSSEQKLVGLVAVYNGYNNVSIQATTSAGNYRVDWGDGTVQTFASGVTASYSHSYSSFSTQTPFRGYRQAIVTVTPVSGNITGLTFNVTASGRPTTDMSNWLDITMSFPSMTSCVFGSTSTTIRHTLLEQVTILNCALTTYANMFAVGCTTLAKFFIENTGNPTSADSMCLQCYSLVEFNSFKMNTVTNMNSTFSNCISLQNPPYLDLSSATSLTSTFLNCRSLITYRIKTTSALTNVNSTFSACQSLTNPTLFDTSAVTNVSDPFTNCISMTYLPNFDFSSATLVNSLANNCTALRYVPPYMNFPAAVTFTNNFSLCTSLVTVPYLNLPVATNLSGTFATCRNLLSVNINAPLAQNLSTLFANCFSLKTVGSSVFGGTATLTNISQMFNGCYTCESLPAMDLSACTNGSTAFSQMSSLKSPVPTYNTAAMTNAASMFSVNLSVREIPAFNFSAVSSAANIANFLSGVTGITRFQPTGIRFSFTLANNQLNAAALNEVYTNLGTASAQTLTVTGNPGTSGDDPSIATAKGWTVNGS